MYGSGAWSTSGLWLGPSRVSCVIGPCEHGVAAGERGHMSGKSDLYAVWVDEPEPVGGGTGSGAWSTSGLWLGPSGVFCVLGHLVRGKMDETSVAAG